MTEWLLTGAYTFLLICFITRSTFFSIKGAPKHWLAGIFLLKIVAGALLAYIYTHIYTNRADADIFRYFDDSKVMYDALFTNPLDFLRMLTGIGADVPHMEAYYSRMQCWNAHHTNLITRLNALMRPFSLGTYMTHTVLFAFIAFAGQAGIARVFMPLAPTAIKKKLLLVTVFLLPSTLLWSSGPLKDSISFFAFGLFFYHFTQWLRAGCSLKKPALLWLLFTCWLLVLNKAYVLVAALPALLVYFLMLGGRPLLAIDKTKPFTDKLFLKILAVYSLFLLLAAGSHYLPDQYNIPFQIAHKQEEFIRIGTETITHSYIAPKSLSENPWKQLANCPAAIYHTLNRPSFSQPGSGLTHLAALENLLLAMMLMATFFFAKARQKSLPAVLFSWGFTLWLFALIGLTTPIVGAAVRYRTIALPFMASACILMFDPVKFEKLLRKTVFLTQK